MKSIRTKLILMTITCVIAMAGSVGFIFVEKTRNYFEIDVINRLEEIIYKESNELTDGIKHVENMSEVIDLLVTSMIDYENLISNKNYPYEFAENIDYNIKSIASSGILTKSAYFYFLPEYANGFPGIWYSDENGDGEVTLNNNFAIQEYDEFKVGREWFYTPIETKEPHWTFPYIGYDKYDKEIVYISYTRPVIIDDKVVGVVGADYYLNDIEKKLNEISVFGSKGGILLDEKYNVLLYPTLNREYNSFDKSEIYNWIKQDSLDTKFNIKEYDDLEGGNQLFAYSKLNNNWILVLPLNKDDIYEWIDNLEFFVMVAILIGTIIIIVVVYNFTSLIVTPLESLSDYIILMGNRNYANEISKKLLNKKDEIGILSKNIETMRILHKETIEEMTLQNINLDLIVKERTDILFKTNEYLETTLGENEEKSAELELVNNELEHAIENMIETQKQLIESEKLASIGFLATGVAHEINTPIGTILTILTYLEKQEKQLEEKFEAGILVKKDLDKYLETSKKTFDMMHENIKKTSSIIEKFKSVDPTTHFYVETVINVKKFINIIISSMDLKYTSNFDIKVMCDSELEIKIDSSKLSQILVHLIENSVKHGFANSNSGIISIKVEKIENKIILNFKDNGKGIEEKNKKNIFLPFYSSSFSGENSGLGLNIVYNIVTRIFNGSIICESKIEEGTSFNIELCLNNKQLNVD